MTSQSAAGQGADRTAARLYTKLLESWLKAEALKIDPNAPGTISWEGRQALLDDLAAQLWRTGERDVTEDTLRQSLARSSTCPASS